MHAEDFVINKSSDWHTVEHILELFPDANAVSPLALIIEPIHSIDLPGLVVTSKQEEVLLVLNFVSQKQDNGLK